MKKIYLIFVNVVSFLLITTSNNYGQLAGQLPLMPSAIPQFIDPLPHFAGLRVDATGGANLTIRYQPTQQIAVSTGTVLATGTVGPLNQTAGLGRYWGYSISKNGVDFTPPHWPAYSIEARRGTPVNVRYENMLDGETYASVNLVADQTLHWADPLMAMNNMLMTPYEGPVPVSPHLHGGEVASESDGGPDSWFTPGYGITGPSWEKGVTENYFYPNTQEEATLWYHDHALGVTRLNVYAGLAGFYLLRGPQEEALSLPGFAGDDLVQEVAPVGKSGTFNPNPYLPEIEIAIQDRMFDNTGALYFPNIPTNPMVHPFWNPEFIGDVITVNGKTWPYLSVAPRKYRFRLLNGSNARFYELELKGTASGKQAPVVTQIGTDGGFLDAPVPITGKLILAPGERADVIIDFSKSAVGATWTMTNSAKVPYPNGTAPNPATVGRIMQFIVNGLMVSAANSASPGMDKSAIPASLRSTPLVKLTNFAGATNVAPAVTRQLTLNEAMGMGGPLEVLVNNSKWDMNGMMVPGYEETELPVEGTTELWQIINTTADAHPIHLHLVQFQLVGRQAFNLNTYNKAYNGAFPGGVYVPSAGPPLAYNIANADGAIGGNPAVNPFLQGKLKPANLNERGWKDTYIVYPGEVTTFAVRFAPTDKAVNALPSDLVFSFDPGTGPGYVWHCHIIDHEDNEMMRPYSVISSPARSSGFANPLLGRSNKTAAIKASAEAAGFVLEQNYPNPVTGQTEIRFTLPSDSRVRLTLFNQFGEVIKVFLDSKAPAGQNTVKLDVGGLKEGIYYYQLKTDSFTDIKKMIIGK